MSYTQHTASAECTLEGVKTTTDAVKLITDWVTNHPEDFPDVLDQDGTEEEIADFLSPYIEVNEGIVTITVDSESDNGNYDSDVFDFITSMFMEINTMDYMTVVWTCYDSRDGLSSGTDYYDQNGKYFSMVDKMKDSKAMDSIAKLLSGNEWNVDTLMSISDLVTGTGREIKDLEN